MRHIVNHKQNGGRRKIFVLVSRQGNQGILVETPSRSFVKAVLWNLLGLVSMSGVGFALTGSITTGGTLAVINTALGFTMYLGYERIWARIRWGRHV